MQNTRTVVTVLLSAIALAADFTLGSYELFTLSDRIGIAQVIILAVTAVVIYWYTVETQRIRTETARSNAIMREQLEVLQATHKDKRIQEELASDPVIVFDGASGSRSEFGLRLRNDGAAIRDVVVTPNGDFHVSFPKTPLWENKGEKPLAIKADPEKGEFVSITISFVDALGRARAQMFQISCITRTFNRMLDPEAHSRETSSGRRSNA